MIRKLVRKVWSRRQVLVEAGLRLGGAAMQVLSAAVVARSVSTVMAGHYFIGFTAVMIAAVLCRAGFDNALTRFVASEVALGRPATAYAIARGMVGRYLMRSIPASLLLLGAAWGWSHWKHGVGEFGTELWPFLAAIPFLGVAALSGVALQGAGKSFASVLAMFLIHNLVVIAAVLLPDPLREAGAFNLAFLVGAGVAAVVGWICLVSALRQPPTDDHAATLALRQSEMGSVVRDNAWTVVANLALTWGPLGLIGVLSNPVEAARFGMASRLAQLVAFSAPALNFVLAPRFAALRATQRSSELRKLFLQSTLLALGLSSVVALPMIVLAQPLMVFFGPEYAASALVLALLAGAQWAAGSAGASIQFLAMTGSERQLRRIYVITALAAVAAGAPLVWGLGANGGAAMALGSFLVLNLLCSRTALGSSRKLALEAGAGTPNADADTPPGSSR